MNATSRGSLPFRGEHSQTFDTVIHLGWVKQERGSVLFKTDCSQHSGPSPRPCSTQDARPRPFEIRPSRAATQQGTSGRSGGAVTGHPPPRRIPSDFRCGYTLVPPCGERGQWRLCEAARLRSRQGCQPHVRRDLPELSNGFFITVGGHFALHPHLSMRRRQQPCTVE